MAHVVPKREPCRKCNNPVFLAERLVINQTLYHRTCFRCARCNTILSVGYFYETEKDHEFCCEQCPDEEKPAGPKIESNRLSIAQKIALFERESSSVLKKSLSDEEKSKSLQRQSPANSSVFNSFLATQITEVKAESSEDDDEKTVASSDSDTDNDDAISDKKFKISDHKSIPDNFVATKELTRGKDIKAIAKVAENHSESQEVGKKIALADKKVEKVPEEIDEFDDIELEFDKLVEEAEKSISVDMPDVKEMKRGKSVKAIRVVQNGGKVDEPEEKIVKNEEKVGKFIENVAKIEDKVVEENNIDGKVQENLVKHEEKSEEFEILEEKNVKTEESRDNIAGDQEFETNAVLSSDNVEKTEENAGKSEENLKETEDKEEFKNIPRIEILEVSTTENEESFAIIENSVQTETIKNVSQISEANSIVENFTDSMQDNLSVNIENKVDAVETADESSNEVSDLRQTSESPLKSVETFEHPSSSENIQASFEEKSVEVLDKNSEEILQPVDNTQEDKITYPDDLNPFGDEDEPSEALQPVKRPSLNPFGSCSEDEDEKESFKPSARNSGTLPKPPRPPLPRAMTLKKSTNPFGSDDEDESEQKPSICHKTPVPTPRKMMV